MAHSNKPTSSIREFCPLTLPIFMHDNEGNHVVKTLGEVCLLLSSPCSLHLLLYFSSSVLHPFHKSEVNAYSEERNLESSFTDYFTWSSDTHSSYQCPLVPKICNPDLNQRLRRKRRSQGNGKIEDLCNDRGHVWSVAYV